MLTIREVIKTFYNALLQRFKKYRGNWEQNDPTADDYIKNRPFYTDEINKETVVAKTTFTTTESNEWCRPFFFEPVVGQVYIVTWNKKLYECVAYEFNEAIWVGNISIGGEGKDTGEPFLYGYRDSNYVLCVRSPGTHTIEVSCAKVVKLDKKYLPDLDLAAVATSGNYYDLENTPTIYSDVVRYNVYQGLTTSQKTVARDNIGAAAASDVTGVVRYNTSQSQSLTDAQKQQARTNIGAGTSSFSGSYNDLTNVPVAQSVPSQSGTSTTRIDILDFVINGRSKIYRTQNIFDITSSVFNKLNNSDIKGYFAGGSITVYSPNSYGTYGLIDKVKVNNIVYYGAGIGSNVGNQYEQSFLISNNGFIIITGFNIVNNSDIIKYFTINYGGILLEMPIDYLFEGFIPSTIQRVGDDVIIPSSTSDSDKKFKITVDDSGKPAFTNTSDSADSYTPTDLPTVTVSDSGKFLRVSSTGEWVAETVDKAVQPDWNQNDSAAPDYVKNRPFYESIQLTTFLEEQQIDFSSSFTTPEPIVSGETYVVHWDDAEYTIEATSQDIFGDGSIMIPYLEQADGLFEISTVTMTAADKGIHNVAIYTAEIYRKTIDEKLIPDSIARTKSVVRFISGVGPDEIGNVTVSYLLLSDRPSLDKGSKPDSIRQGYLTKANGSCSHAEGSYTEANGDYSHAEGLYTIASRTCQHAEGRYNIEDSSGTYAHIVGNGSSTKRSNAYTLDWQGNAWFAGMVEAPAIILKSSSEGSSKRFKVTIDDSGTLTATEVTA